MNLKDNIRVGVSGVIQSGKDQFTEAATGIYQDILLEALTGNFWVPHQVVSHTEKRNRELFRKYSAQPEKYAFAYQMECLANRQACQKIVDSESGLVLQNEPLDVERATFGEANKDYMGEFFPIYDNVSRQAISSAKKVDLHVYLQVKDEEKGISELLDRIKCYGREGEKKFIQEPSYLVQLIRYHENFFKEVKIPVIYVDATHPSFRKDRQDKEHLKTVLAGVAKDIRKYESPPRLKLFEWEAVEEYDHNRAHQAARFGRRHLRDYLAKNQKIITLAGLVSSGKTGLAELISDELEIALSRELSGRNVEVRDNYLGNFLNALSDFKLGKIPMEDLRKHCYALQEHLIPQRSERRQKFFDTGKSFVEDRSPVEDPCIFWKHFQEPGYLTEEQVSHLQSMAVEAYSKAPKSDLLIKVLRPAQQCRQLAIGRGRDAEKAGWRLEDLEHMERLFRDFFRDMEQYQSHKGPKFELDMEKFNLDSEIHRGFLWQEMMFHLMEPG